MNTPPYSVDPNTRVAALQSALEVYAVKFKEQVERIEALEAALRDVERLHQMIYRRVYNSVQHILGEQHLTGTIWLATKQAAEDIAALAPEQADGVGGDGCNAPRKGITGQ